MAKVSIITRAFNRLEYTVLCVRGINQLVGYSDYEHIIVEQGSTDGTDKWLKSLELEGYYNLNVIYNKENTGDAGGMKQGFDIIGNDCEYVMQFDNDCMPITNDFLRKMVDVMDARKDIGILMMKRNGVGTEIKYKNLESIKGVTIGRIDRATCCMMMRVDNLKKINMWKKDENIGWGFCVSKRVAEMGLKLMKTVDVRVEHIDGTGNQRHKYPHYFKSVVSKGTNYSKVDYKNEQ